MEFGDNQLCICFETWFLHTHKKRLKGYRLSEIEIFFSVPTLLLQNGATVHDFYYNALEAAFVPLLMLLFKRITLVSLFTCLIQDYQKL